jgi:hypothetical protein
VVIGEAAAASPLIDLSTEVDIEAVYSQWRSRQQISSPAVSSDDMAAEGGAQIKYSPYRRRGHQAGSDCSAGVAAAYVSELFPSAKVIASSSKSSSCVLVRKNKKNKCKTGSSHVISLSNKKKIKTVAAKAAKKRAKHFSGAHTAVLSQISASMFMRECKVRAQLLAIPPQILEGTLTAGTSSTGITGGSSGDETAPAATAKPLLPFQIAKNLQERGLPRVCVKYAEIVPPRRETVLELLQSRKKTTAQSGAESAAGAKGS